MTVLYTVFRTSLPLVLKKQAKGHKRLEIVGIAWFETENGSRDVSTGSVIGVVDLLQGRLYMHACRHAYRTYCVYMQADSP